MIRRVKGIKKGGGIMDEKILKIEADDRMDDKNENYLICGIDYCVITKDASRHYMAGDKSSGKFYCYICKNCKMFLKDKIYNENNMEFIKLEIVQSLQKENQISYKRMIKSENTPHYMINDKIKVVLRLVLETIQEREIKEIEFKIFKLDEKYKEDEYKENGITIRFGDKELLLGLTFSVDEIKKHGEKYFINKALKHIQN